VQIRPDRPEALVEGREQPEDGLHFVRGEFPAAFRVGPLVFLAEDPQLRECLGALVVFRQHPLVRRQPPELHLQAACDLGGLRLP